eukprot:1444574-Pyramimonas_sp.AAC.1
MPSGRLGPSWGPLGPSWGLLGRLGELGPSRGLLKPCGALLGASSGLLGDLPWLSRVSLMGAFWGRVGLDSCGQSRGCLGHSWALFQAVFKPSGGPLGPFGGDIGGPSGRCEDQRH